VYSDFYEIPLPALRFEKVEETDTKVKRHRREQRLPNLDHVRSKRKRRSNKEKQIHSQRNDTQKKTQKHFRNKKHL